MKREIPTYITKDGSIIRELLHPDIHPDVKNQSLAEATVTPGQTTIKHLHKTSEEIYYITQGKGVMYLEDESFEMAIGDSVVIPPETAHQITNTGDIDLIILCCCSPSYNHNDTVILDD